MGLCASVRKTTGKCVDYFVDTDPTSIPWTEILFYIINILYLFIVSYYILMAYTEVAWQTALETLEPQFELTNVEMSIYHVAVIHHMIALLLIVAIIVGVRAAYGGYVNVFYAYIILVAVIIGLEVYTVVRMGFATRNCVARLDTFRQLLKYHVNNYYLSKPFMNFVDKDSDPITNAFIGKPIYRRDFRSTFLMGDIQKSLGCCGYDSYFDYLDPSKGALGLRDPSDSTGAVSYMVPESCCAPKLAPNIHCSKELWGSQQLHRQIQTEGCAIRLVDLCKEIMLSSGRGGCFICVMHFILYLLSLPLVYIQIKVLRFLASELPYTFEGMNFMHRMSHHVHPISQQGFFSLEQEASEEFHEDDDFVLSEEVIAFIDDLREEQGLARVDEDVHKNVLVVRAGGKDEPERIRALQERMPSFAMTSEDKGRFHETQERFNYMTNPDVIQYMTGALNPENTNQETEAVTLQDLKQTEIRRVMEGFYKDAVEEIQRAESRRQNRFQKY